MLLRPLATGRSPLPAHRCRGGGGAGSAAFTVRQQLVGRRWRWAHASVRCTPASAARQRPHCKSWGRGVRDCDFRVPTPHCLISGYCAQRRFPRGVVCTLSSRDFGVGRLQAVKRAERVANMMPYQVRTRACRLPSARARLAAGSAFWPAHCGAQARAFFLTMPFTCMAGWCTHSYAAAAFPATA
jgi:hypothetical protein